MHTITAKPRSESDPALWEIAERSGRVLRCDGLDGGTGPVRRRDEVPRKAEPVCRDRQTAEATQSRDVWRRKAETMAMGRNKAATRANTISRGQEGRRSRLVRNYFYFLGSESHWHY
jgi:hypothetical protein